ncbi:MAG: hypothetical protein WC283_03305 [Candidatus Paceibacterota bacterium]|jgi:uncharacterized Zn finger protein (UPF0148 family)
MTKAKENQNPQAVIKVEEIKESKEIKKPVITVKEKIDKTVDNWKDSPEELKKQIFQLVQRILYPEQFCPECDERMFFNPATSGYNCPNCGYESKVVVNTSAPIINNQVNTPGGKVPDIVEKTIAEANESMKEIPIPTRPSSLGDKIKKLVNDRDAGGSSVPTKEAEAQLRGADKNIANKVNWV